MPWEHWGPYSSPIRVPGPLGRSGSALGALLVLSCVLLGLPWPFRAPVGPPLVHFGWGTRKKKRKNYQKSSKKVPFWRRSTWLKCSK